MASGIAHAAAARRVLWCVAPVSIALAVVPPAAAGLVCGALVGMLATPDLDIHDKVTYCERRIMRWNRFAGWCWWVFWLPYGWRNNHRGRSHRWPRGTWDRFSYLCWLPALVTVALFGWPAVLFWLFVFVGQSAQDIVHIAMDGMLLRRR